MRTQAIGLNALDDSMWWIVDLGGYYKVYSITIVFKNYDMYPNLGMQ